jgi:hypothetical protein
MAQSTVLMGIDDRGHLARRKAEEPTAIVDCILASARQAR